MNKIDPTNLVPKALERNFIVTGVAFVPVQCEMRVSAIDPVIAKSIACLMFQTDKRAHIVPNSQDEGAAFDFQPSEVTEAP